MNDLPLWCRGIEEVLEIQPNLRRNYTRGRDEMLVEKDGKQWWAKCEIDRVKNIVYCCENGKTYDLKTGKRCYKQLTKNKE